MKSLPLDDAVETSPNAKTFVSMSGHYCVGDGQRASNLKVIETTEKIHLPARRHPENNASLASQAPQHDMLHQRHFEFDRAGGTDCLTDDEFLFCIIRNVWHNIICHDAIANAASASVRISGEECPAAGDQASPRAAR